MLFPRVQTPRVQTPQEDMLYHPDPSDYQTGPEVAPEHTDTDRDTVSVFILDHIGNNIIRMLTHPHVHFFQ